MQDYPILRVASSWDIWMMMMMVVVVVMVRTAHTGYRQELALGAFAEAGGVAFAAVVVVVVAVAAGSRLGSGRIEPGSSGIDTGSCGS